MSIADKIKEQESRFYNTKLMENYDIKEPSDVVPTDPPKNFFEQFYLYENGATIRLYIYINGTWRYSALT